MKDSLTMFGNTQTAKHLGNEGGLYVCCDPDRSKRKPPGTSETFVEPKFVLMTPMS